MPHQIGDIQLFMGPQEVGAPDSLKDAIINFIDGATNKLDVAIQELESEDIARAIIAAKQRGVKVRIVLETYYLSVTSPTIDPFISGGSNEQNRTIYNALLRAKIDVKSDFNSKIFHQKFIIRDGSFVLTGSTNFTDTGISTNLNHVIIIKDRGVVKRYREEFEEIRKGRFGKESLPDWGPPKVADVANIPVKILFAPDHAPEMEIMKQMLKAKNNIKFAIFTFAQSSGIDDAMMALTRSGIQIRGAMDNKQANQKWAATHPIHQAGVDLHIVRQNGPLRKLHHKLMVVDDQLIIAGSFNYTGPANYINDENIVIIGDLDETDPQKIDLQKQLAQYASDEIERIIRDHGEVIT